MRKDFSNISVVPEQPTDSFFWFLFQGLVQVIIKKSFVDYNSEELKTFNKNEPPWNL